MISVAHCSGDSGGIPGPRFRLISHVPSDFCAPLRAAFFSGLSGCACDLGVQQFTWTCSTPKKPFRYRVYGV